MEFYNYLFTNMKNGIFVTRTPSLVYLRVSALWWWIYRFLLRFTNLGHHLSMWQNKGQQQNTHCDVQDTQPPIQWNFLKMWGVMSLNIRYIYVQVINNRKLVYICSWMREILRPLFTSIRAVHKLYYSSISKQFLAFESIIFKL